MLQYLYNLKKEKQRKEITQEDIEQLDTDRATKNKLKSILKYIEEAP